MLAVGLEVGAIHTALRGFNEPSRDSFILLFDGQLRRSHTGRCDTARQLMVAGCPRKPPTGRTETSGKPYLHERFAAHLFERAKNIPAEQDHASQVARERCARRGRSSPRACTGRDQDELPDGRLPRSRPARLASRFHADITRCGCSGTAVVMPSPFMWRGSSIASCHDFDHTVAYAERCFWRVLGAGIGLKRLSCRRRRR